MKWSEFTKNQNGAVNVSNYYRKRSILLNYRLLHICKALCKLFRVFKTRNPVFKHFFIRMLIYMLRNIAKQRLAGKYAWKPQLPWNGEKMKNIKLMYTLCEKHCTNWYATYFLYKKYAQLWRCRINVSNIVFKHFCLSNKGKMRYFEYRI